MNGPNAALQLIREQVTQLLLCIPFLIHGPILSGNDADQVVATISFADFDRDGTPDLVLRYGDAEEVFFNKGGTFQVPGGKSSAPGRRVLA